MRIEPPPSLPWLKGATPAAVIEEAPPEEPPGVCLRFHGLRVMPCSGESVSAFQPNSGVVVLPRITMPAARKRPTIGAPSATGVSSVACEPSRVGQPLTLVVSLIEVGTPSNGDSVEVVDSTLQRVKRLQPHLNFLVLLDADGARAAARASEATGELGCRCPNSWNSSSPS
jgi:hypothetical protein